MLEVLAQYGKWHYGKGIAEGVINAKNFLKFLLHFFSVTLLLKTLFHPWRRMGEKYKGGLDLGALFSSLIVNTLMRVVGVFSRLVIIFLGIVTLLVSFVGCFVAFAVWIFVPFISLGCVAAGITLFLKAL